MARVALLSLALVASSIAIGCGPGGGTYCQSGSKYGTQCYSTMDVSNPPSTPPPPPGVDPNERR